MVEFKGLNTKENAVKIQVKTATILIWKESNLTGFISVRNKDGKVLWQKDNCTALDLSFAIEVADRNIETGILETKFVQKTVGSIPAEEDLLFETF
jgi:hypothetical protein